MFSDRVMIFIHFANANAYKHSYKYPCIHPSRYMAKCMRIVRQTFVVCFDLADRQLDRKIVLADHSSRSAGKIKKINKG